MLCYVGLGGLHALLCFLIVKHCNNWYQGPTIRGPTIILLVYTHHNILLPFMITPPATQPICYQSIPISHTSYTNCTSQTNHNNNQVGQKGGRGQYIVLTSNTPLYSACDILHYYILPWQQYCAWLEQYNLQQLSHIS